MNNLEKSKEFGITNINIWKEKNNTAVIKLSYFTEIFIFKYNILHINGKTFKKHVIHSCKHNIILFEDNKTHSKKSYPYC